MSPTESLTLPNGTTVTVTPVKRLADGGARMDIEADDGRRWRVDIPKTGDGTELVNSWEDGTLADLTKPDWLGEVVARIQHNA
jgi:hypothetical protein